MAASPLSENFSVSRSLMASSNFFQGKFASPNGYRLYMPPHRFAYGLETLCKSSPPVPNLFSDIRNGSNPLHISITMETLPKADPPRSLKIAPEASRVFLNSTPSCWVHFTCHSGCCHRTILSVLLEDIGMYVESVRWQWTHWNIWPTQSSGGFLVASGSLVLLLSRLQSK